MGLHYQGAHLLGVADELHGSVVHVHVGQLHIRVLLCADRSNALPPQLGDLITQQKGTREGPSHKSSQPHVIKVTGDRLQSPYSRTLFQPAWKLLAACPGLLAARPVPLAARPVPLAAPPVPPAHLEDVGLVHGAQALRSLPRSLEPHARNPVNLHPTPEQNKTHYKLSPPGNKTRSSGHTKAYVHAFTVRICRHKVYT